MITIEHTLRRQFTRTASRLFHDCLPRRGQHVRQETGPTTELRPHPTGTQLTVRHADRALALILPGQSLSEPRACSTSWLRACQQGTSALRISFDGDQIRFAWQQRGLPQQWTCMGRALPEPLPPTRQMQPSEPRMLTALVAASSATDQAATRYALANLQLDGQTGTITGTDGRQLLHFTGFRFPWSERAILLPAKPLLALAHLNEINQVTVGLIEQQWVVQADRWTLRLPVETTGRFPNVQMVLRKDEAPANRVYLDADDRRYLQQHIRRLPGADAENSPVMFDLNGHVDLWAAGDEQTPALRIRLIRSLHLGEPRRCLLNRQYLKLASGLPIEHMELAAAPETPLVFCGEGVTYLVQPLTGELKLDDPLPPLLADSAMAS